MHSGVTIQLNLEMNDRTKVFNCDCMAGMKDFPDKYFELAIVLCILAK